jgi:crotonobetainyl-CoA:carnitine CoA-transferase CaiB-like acyl-CoA transferase
MSITGEPDGAPVKVGVALADVIAGKDAAVAVLAALAARERGALGGSVRERQLNVSLIHSATAALVNVAQNTLVSGHEARRWGNAHANLCPYELFDTEDQALVIAVGSDAQWRACMNALGLDHLAADETLATNAGRLANRERVVAEMSRALRTRPASHWTERLHRAGVPCGVVRTVREAVRDANGSPRTGVPPLEPGRVRLEPPMLDQHGTLIRRHGWEAFSAKNALPRGEREH